ncbi:MAG: mechanosensitive ion channel family protein [Candidatus Micrarchaeota archaeon]|nr:mechanosensitive ion channel family protein [Candidatus Micrarchaeota archaeon]
MSVLNLFGFQVEDDIFISFLLLISSIIFSRITHYVFKNYIKKITEKTKTDVDDIIIGVVEKPLEQLIVLVGIYLALISIRYFANYSEPIKESFFVLIVLWFAMVIQQLVSFFIPRWIFVKHAEHKKSPELIAKVLNIIIYLIAFLIILGHFKIEITPIIATLGIGGLAVGLALQDSLSNFFAGLYIVSGSPIKVGDYIELKSDNVSGYVEDIGWRATTIRTLGSNLIIIPNSKLGQSIVVNYSISIMGTSAIVETGVSYSSDLEKVEQVAFKVANHIQKNSKFAITSFTPEFHYLGFGESNINFRVILKANTFPNRIPLMHEFIKALKFEFDTESIEISYPVRKIYSNSLFKKKK